MKNTTLLSRLLLYSLSMLPVLNSNAQEIFEGPAANQKINGTALIRSSNYSEIPSYIKFKPGNEPAFEKWNQWATENFGLGFQTTFRLIRSDKDKIGQEHFRYQQVYNGIPVTHGIWIVHVKAGKVLSMNGLLYKNLATAPVVLNEAAALNKALAYVGAQQYKWELPTEEAHIKQITNNPNATHYPKGKLTYITKGTNFKQEANRIAYSFTIYAHKPVSKSEVYIDANTGEVIFDNEMIHEADAVGTAVTAYSGTQSMTADSFGGSYRLRETGRGNGINTYNMLTGTDYGAAIDFTDSDNFWNNVNAAHDEVATDAHWGAEMTYDYYFTQHGRNSIDNAGFALNSYVHYDVAFANAFWDGSVMTYGDGDGTYNPFTALDIAGHEVTHGLTTFSADLVYADESGALNESFSDIFGVAIEWFANPSTADWLMGEDIGTVIRSMSNPPAYGDPDTYFGTNWAPLGGADNGGVHTNSGVQNFWFYLLANGGTGTNDIGNAYTVSGLGLDHAGDIAFRNLTVYLTTSSQYADARFYAIQSAVDLFGGCSPEVEATTNAWYAVGVGPEYVADAVADFTPNTTGGCTNPLTVDFANNSINGINYTWNFGDGGTSTAINPSHTYTANGVYTVSLIADGGLCGIDTLVVSDQIFVGQLPNPVVTNGGRCDAGTVTLSATSSGDISWYDVATGGAAIATGNVYTTPVLSSTATYYVEATSGGTSYLGPLNTSIGTTGTTTSNRWLVFDAYQPFTLVSVWVNANTAGNRTIELRNSAGTVLQSTTVNIPLGTSRITLNFAVPVGTNMQLGTDAASVPTNLLRNSTGVTYPYTISGLASITGSNGGSSFYYFFYDWEIQESPCSSERVPVTAAITTTGPVTTGASRCGTGVVTLSATGSTGTLNWYTAATGGTLVNTGSTYSPLLTGTTTYYVEEQMPGTPSFVGPADNTFGTGGYFSGDQHLIFDVSAVCTLQSVRVFANSSGNRTIQLRDNAGTVLQSITVNIPSGNQRVTLGFALTPGTNYQLGWATGSSPDLYRNNSGPSFPYTLPGLVSITSSSAGTGFYYAYYDWEIVQPGCTTARTAVTGTINATSDATISNVGTVCSADAAFNLTAVDAGGTWSGTGITNTSTGTFDPGIGTGTYTITYTIAGTCGASDTEDIVVTDQYNATITSNLVCIGDGPVNLTAVDAGGTWSGTGISNASAGTFDPTGLSAGTYEVIYTISGSCGNTDTTNITVTNSANASINSISGPLCSDAGAITLTAAQTGGTWSSSCGTCINPTTGVFDPVTAGVGNWEVIYTIGGTCGDTDTLTVSVQNCTGINTTDNLYDVTIFPNPAHDVVYLQINNAIQKQLTAYILNSIGERVWNYTGINQTGTYAISTTTFAKGVYVVYTIVDGKQLVQKLIIH